MKKLSFSLSVFTKVEVCVRAWSREVARIRGRRCRHTVRARAVRTSRAGARPRWRYSRSSTSEHMVHHTMVAAEMRQAKIYAFAKHSKGQLQQRTWPAFARRWRLGPKRTAPLVREEDEALSPTSLPTQPSPHQDIQLTATRCLERVATRS